MFTRERQVAIKAVSLASKLCQSVFKQLVEGQTLTKTDASPVTIADFGAQAVINKIIYHEFKDFMIGEEDSSDLRENPGLLEKVLELCLTVDKSFTKQSVMESIDLGKYPGGQGRFWTLDPIDGTKGFLRGDQYAICLALIVDGKVQLAVQGCPNLLRDISNPQSQRGSLFVAVRGQGAFEKSLEEDEEIPIRVSDVSSPSDTSFCESVEAAHSSQSDTAKIAELLKITKPPVRMDSQCKYALIARGDAGIYLRIPTRADYQEKIWDHAGGSLLIEEAGGKILDCRGNLLDFSQGRTLSANAGIIATNTKICNQVVTAVRDTLGNKI